ncbi:retrovirus-related pol polyprotein from transposon TNT 1-94 [Tanacetum coccineum]
MMLEFDPKGDILLLEKLLSDNTSSPLPAKELYFLDFKMIKSSIDTPLDFEDDYYDSEGDIIYLESLVINDTILNLPPEVFLDRDPRSLEDEPDKDDLESMIKVFDPRIHEKIISPTYVRLPFEDRHYLSLTFVIKILLPFLTYFVNSLLLLSSRSEDTIFDPGISAFSFYFLEPVVSHRSETFIFNTVITSLKALDESFSSRNHVRKFLRALPTKWRLKVTAIEETKDLSTLPLDVLIGNLKVYEVRKVASDEEVSCSESDDEEYAMAVRDFKKFFKRRGKFVRQPHDDKKNFRKIKEDKKEKEDRSDSEDDTKKEIFCLMALDNNELKKKLLDFPKQQTQKDKHGIGFTEDIASTSNTKTKKSGLVDKEMSTVEPALPVPSARELASSIEQNRLFTENAKTLESNIVRLKVKLEPDEWIKDSGCSRHMTGNKDLFSSYKAIDGGQICDKKCKVLFSDTGSEILKDGITIGRGIRKNGLYIMKMGNSPKDSLCLTSIDDTSTLWHRRLGHANMRLIQSLSSKELVRNLPKLKFESHFCDACNIGKQVHASHKAKNMVSTTKCL